MKDIRVAYDRNADVLYVNYQSASAQTAVDVNGAVKRFAEDNTLVGITIIDFSEWLREQV